MITLRLPKYFNLQMQMQLRDFSRITLLMLLPLPTIHTLLQHKIGIRMIMLIIEWIGNTFPPPLTP